MNGTKNVSIVNVELPSDLAKRVRRMASELGLSSAEVVRAAILKGVACLDTAAKVNTPGSFKEKNSTSSKCSRQSRSSSNFR